jgi:hypothetical protein
MLMIRRSDPQLMRYDGVLWMLMTGKINRARRKSNKTGIDSPPMLLNVVNKQQLIIGCA